MAGSEAALELRDVTTAAGSPAAPVSADPAAAEGDAGGKPAAPSASPTLEELARTTFEGLNLALDDAAARLGRAADPEAVHDVRVATRRLSEALRVLAPVLPGRRAARLRRAVRKLRRQLGEVRNDEVMEQRAAGLLEAVSLAEGLALEDLILLLRRRVAQAYARLSESVDHLGLPRLQRRLGRLPGRVRPPASPPPPPSPHAFAAEQLTQARLRTLAAEEALEQSGGTDPEALHRLRIRVKQLRYTLELFASLTPDVSATALRALKRRQELLGELQDVHVFQQFIIAQRDRLSGRGQARHAQILEQLLGSQDLARQDTLKALAAAQREQPVSSTALAIEDALWGEARTAPPGEPGREGPPLKEEEPGRAD
jgi:CHAD domain-containing protein